ncbi:MAG: ABC transporter permease, partial [Candidatus Limnocylindria bacterium]
LPFTYGLALASAVIAIPVGLAAGIVAATRRGTLMDLLVSGAAIFGLSMPVYWLGLMLIVLFSIQLRILPAAGAGEPLGFVLPAVTLSLGLIAVTSRQSRSAMLEVLGQEYVRTARSKGLSRSAVIVRHALRNALLPVVTAVGLHFGHLLGGAVIVEYVFSWPGIGRFLIESIFARDYPAVQGVVLLLSMSFIAVNLLVDLLYAFIDPRIRYT